MKNLTIKKQVEILESVRDTYLNKSRNFICNGIDYVTRHKYESLRTNPVPSFNFTNVKRICEENKLTLPVTHHEQSGGWWCISNSKVRKEVINILIEELKKDSY